ncbi:expressed unknown protein [Seminavis robusta]|uniref:Uncharacterized protein n=1 Tax=Seminavis robusta TaxID=568900 RepID=A0A9N8DE46_9STRA|nr:expressed unknown protein [Seminavis robusta]|eukprot:Sro30_g019620.1 n/a (545) ;mRNA; r:77594-79516
MSAEEIQKSLEAAVAAINDPKGNNLYDVTIICTTDDHQAAYWMDKLSQGVCQKPTDAADKNFPMVLAVSEDWNDAGGAGNGLGTLYAFVKASKLAQEKYGVDLQALLAEQKISAALFHTAGKGTRLAPLPASENNNKPGVKLPFCNKIKDGSFKPISVLEAVVKQTGIYASSRMGRLSVYWGDQVFIPSAAFKYNPTHHADIMCTLLGDTAPTAEEWAAQGLDKYGVIAVIKSADGGSDNAAQVEKVSHATATEMLGKLGNIGQVGPSLGSFSVSAAILKALCDEYATELSAKTGKFDTDPHFWMPLTLSCEDYCTLMKQKGVEEGVSKAHHERMSAMKSKFDLAGMGLFGAVDVGKAASWWDYGQLKLYSNNSLLVLKDSEDAKLLHKFLGVTEKQIESTLDGVTVDGISRTFRTKAKSGSIKDSVLANVQATEIQADGAIIVNCVAKTIKAGKGAILYNLVGESDAGIVAADGEVIVAVTEESGDSMLLKSRMDIDGGKAWKQKLDMNSLSFEDVHKKNKEANIGEIEKKRTAKFDTVAASL